MKTTCKFYAKNVILKKTPSIPRITEMQSEQKNKLTPQQMESQLNAEMTKYINDPLGHVLFSYPWGEGELAGFNGPEPWQVEFLNTIGKETKRRKFNGKDPVDPLLMATASGHGIGKSALTAWIVNWILDTHGELS